LKKRIAVILLTTALSFPSMAWAQENPELRLALDKVALYAETNKLNDAFNLLDQLKEQYPNNPQVLQTEADLNLRIGNRGAGFAALNKAIKLDPHNEDILDRQRTTLLSQGPFAQAGYDFRRTTEAYENREHASGEAMITPSLSASLTVDNDHVHSRTPIIRTNGTSAEFSGDRQRAAATLDKMYDNGNEANATVYGNNNTAGAGAKYSLWDRYGATSLEGDFHRPYWDYVETVIDHGTQDRVRLERKQIISNNWNFTVGGGFNNYNLEHDTNVASAGAWDLNIGYTYPYAVSNKPGDEITLGANYTVDAEYFTHIDHGTNTAGLIYKPLPTSSYEIHALNVSAGKALSSKWYLEGYGGYAVDRLGDNGPLFGAVLEYAPLDHLGIELRGTRSVLGGLGNSERVDQLGMNVKYRW